LDILIKENGIRNGNYETGQHLCRIDSEISVVVGQEGKRNDNLIILER
jgi:hypothetical protein